ncbi:hypothetical protein HAX54_044446 [Datura stramonium]|uniref:Uncharacterized protein n=1 Tax=Datura stramonium TaxID=4076 RepID=A0ABS8WEK4_DATST|nr:hypothetical protein [Datura stramonium]
MINLPLVEISEAQRAEAARSAEEAQLADTTRRVDATQLAATLEEWNRINPPHPRGCNAVWNVLFEGEFEQEEVGFGAIVPPPLLSNAKFNVTSTMMQLLSMKGVFNGLCAEDPN